MEARKRCAECAEEMLLEATRCPHCGGRTSRMHRGGGGRAVAGVCAMLARELGVDVAWVRVAVVVATLFTGGTLPLVYFLLWVFTPSTAEGRAPLQRTLDWFGGLGGSGASRLERRV